MSSNGRLRRWQKRFRGFERLRHHRTHELLLPLVAAALFPAGRKPHPKGSKTAVKKRRVQILMIRPEENPICRCPKKTIAKLRERGGASRADRRGIRQYSGAASVQLEFNPPVLVPASNLPDDLRISWDGCISWFRRFRHRQSRDYPTWRGFLLMRRPQHPHVPKGTSAAHRFQTTDSDRRTGVYLGW